MWSSVRTLRRLRSLLLLVAILSMSGCAIHGEYHPYRDTSMDVEQAYEICRMESDRRLHDTGWFGAARVQSEGYMHSCMAGHGYRH